MPPSVQLMRAVCFLSLLGALASAFCCNLSLMPSVDTCESIVRR